MFQSFYTGLSGMLSFSRSLDNVSNNIANMNTPGFRGADSFYRSLNQGGGNTNTGAGVEISGLGFRFSNGEIRQTGNSTDLAINGMGFFTLLKNGETLFTRSGQFTFDDKGILIERGSNAAVAVLDGSNQPGVLDLSSMKQIAATATTKVTFTGNLSSTATSAHELASITTYNKLGEEVKLKLKFAQNTTIPGAWTVTISGADGTVLQTSEIRFSADGTPTSGFNKISLPLKDSYGGTTPISLEFGEPGVFNKSTSIATGTTSSLVAKVEDGAAAGTLQDVTFDEGGVVKLKYSNSVTKDGPTLALMEINNKDALQQVDGATFRLVGKSEAVIGKAGKAGFGPIATKSLELSNVDLSKEFADMIIIQRGYQASSKILNVANSMLDQLFENTRGR